MWLASGLVGLLVVGIYRFLHSFHCPLSKGHRRGDDASPYYWKHSRDSEKRNGESYLAVDAPGIPAMDIRLESKGDRWAKRIGLAMEHETGDIIFDERFYLVSDHAHVGQALAISGKARDAVTSLMDAGARKISLAGGKLCAKWHWPSDEAMSQALRDGEMVERDVLLEHLRTLAAEMRAAMPEANSRWHPASVKAAALMAVHTMLLAGGCGAYIFLPSRVDDYAMPVLTLGVTAGGGAALGWMVLIFCIMGRTSRTHLVMLDFLMVGVIGWLVASTVTVNHLNQALDQSEPQYQTVEMIRKSTTTHRSRRGGGRRTHYHLHYAPGIGGKSEFRMTVGSDSYHATPVGSIRTLEVRQGAFDSPYGRLR